MVIKALAIGCSHTNCHYLKSEDHWSEMIESDVGIYFFRITKNAIGLSHCVLKIIQSIQNNLFAPEDIEYVVLQKPDPIRFPWWGADHSGYRYPDGLTIFNGMRASSRKFSRLNEEQQIKICDVILNKEKELLLKIRHFFPKAHLAYYHYWADYIKNALVRSPLDKINVELGLYAETIGYYNWNMIVDPKTIPGAYDTEGDIVWLTDDMFKSGWTRSSQDPHPSSKFQKAVARKVIDWLST